MDQHHNSDQSPSSTQRFRFALWHKILALISFICFIPLAIWLCLRVEWIEQADTSQFRFEPLKPAVKEKDLGPDANYRILLEVLDALENVDLSVLDEDEAYREQEAFYQLDFAEQKRTSIKQFKLYVELLELHVPVYDKLMRIKVFDDMRVPEFDVTANFSDDYIGEISHLFTTGMGMVRLACENGEWEYAQNIIRRLATVIIMVDSRGVLIDSLVSFSVRGAVHIEFVLLDQLIEPQQLLSLFTELRSLYLAHVLSPGEVLRHERKIFVRIMEAIQNGDVSALGEWWVDALENDQEEINWWKRWSSIEQTQANLRTAWMHMISIADKLEERNYAKEIRSRLGLIKDMDLDEWEPLFVKDPFGFYIMQLYAPAFSGYINSYKRDQEYMDLLCCYLHIRVHQSTHGAPMALSEITDKEFHRILKIRKFEYKRYTEDDWYLCNKSFASLTGDLRNVDERQEFIDEMELIEEHVELLGPKIWRPATDTEIQEALKKD